MRRIVLGFFGLLLILVVAAAVLIPMLIDKEQVLAIATQKVKEQTGATLTVGGDSKLSLLPNLGLTVADASVTMPGKDQPDITVDSLDLGIRLLPLLSKSIQIDTFSVDGLKATLEASDDVDPLDTSNMNDAQLDAFYARQKRAREAAGQSAGAEAALAVPLALNVNELKITNAQIAMLDKQGQRANTINLKKLEASGLNLDGRSIPVSIDVQLPGDATIDAAINAKVAISQATQLATINDLDVIVTGATPAPVELSGTGVVHLQRQTADLDINIVVDDMRGNGKMRYANFESPQIDSDLHFNLLDPAILMIAGPEAATTPQAKTTTGDEPLPLDALRKLDTRAKLRIDDARFGAHSVKALTAQLRAVNGVINLSNISGKLHDGTLKANAVFNAKHTTAVLNTRGGLNGLQLNQAVIASGSTAKLQGVANLNWQLDGRGRTVNELKEALRGPINLDTNAVTFSGVNVEQLLCQAVALTNKQKLSQSFATDTNVKALGAKVQLANGKAQLAPLTAQLAHVGLQGDGNIDLLDQNFTVTLKAKLSKQLEELDPACSVSNKLTAIDWPIKCQGNLSTDPAKWCSVDAGAIASDLLKYEGEKRLKKEAGKLLKGLFK